MSAPAVILSAVLCAGPIPCISASSPEATLHETSCLVGLHAGASDWRGGWAGDERLCWRPAGPAMRIQRGIEPSVLVPVRADQSTTARAHVAPVLSVQTGANKGAR